MSASPRRASGFLLAAAGVSAFLAAGATPPAPAATGALRGTVRFGAEPPIPSPVPMTGERERALCGASVPDGRLVVDRATRGVRDVLVWLEGAPATFPRSARAAVPIDIGYDHCGPRTPVTLVPVGSTIRIVNSDPFLHNARATDVRTGDTIFNYAVLKDHAHERLLDTPGLFAIHCDVHPHEVAYMLVHDHAFVAATDAAGRWALDAVRPGRYTLHAWHGPWTTPDKRARKAPKGKTGAAGTPWEHVAPITVAAGAPAVVDLELPAP